MDVLLLLALYFLPSIIAWRKRNRGAIFALNLLLGWTGVGWVAALVWSLTFDAVPQKTDGNSIATCTTSHTISDDGSPPSGIGYAPVSNVEREPPVEKSTPFALFVVCACVFLLPVVVALTSSPTNDRSTREPDVSDAHLRKELEAIEQEATRRLYSDDPSGFVLDDLDQRLDRVERVVRSRLDKMNRNPGERGYSLGVRKQAAYKTLLEQGYSPREAQLTVDAMVEHDMLPDPPQR